MSGRPAETRTLSREAYFLDLATELTAASPVPLMLTGARWKDKTLASAAGMALVRHQLFRIARGKHPVLGTRPWFAFIRDNIDRSRAPRRYRSWLQAVSA